MHGLTEGELDVLRRFFRHENAKNIRATTGLNPWAIVAKYRNLPRDQFREVQQHIGIGVFSYERSPVKS